jgi:flagellar protein FlgJ
MITRLGVSPVAPKTPAVPGNGAQPARDAKLQQAVTQLEGVFVQQLYKAMRESVPQQEGIVSGGAGEDMFTAMMDQHLAAETPKHWERGLSQALYRQLSQHLVTPSTSEAATAASHPDTVSQPDL